MDKTRIKKFKKIANYLEPLIRLYIYPLSFISGINELGEKAILNFEIKTFSKHSKEAYIRYTRLPKITDNESNTDSICKSFDDFAIVLQGPILYEDNFTSDTLKLYIHNFPHAKLIVSTWKGVKEEFKIFCKKSGVFLIENDMPIHSGPGNINYQLVSSAAGVNMAKTLGCKYTVKSRTDQRIYAADAMVYFKNILKTFKVENSGVQNCSGRIIFISYGKSFLKRPFCLCDFLTSGYTEDIERLYNLPLDTVREDDYHIKHIKQEEIFNVAFAKKIEPFDNISPYDCFDNFNKLYYECMCAEEYIVYNYYNSYCEKIDSHSDLLKAYNLFLKTKAVIIDDNQLMLYWPKYRLYSGKQETEYDFAGKLTFKKWLDIYNS